MVPVGGQVAGSVRVDVASCWQVRKASTLSTASASASGSDTWCRQSSSPARKLHGAFWQRVGSETILDTVRPDLYCGDMVRNAVVVPLLLLMVTSVSFLSACGGTASTSAGTASAGADTVARVGQVAITRAAVSHWMTALAGVDYYDIAQQPFPRGLAEDPPKYSGCVRRLAAVTGAQVLAGAVQRPVRLEGQRLVRKCQQLFQALKTRAVKFLIETQQTLSAAKELGVTPSASETQRALSALGAEHQFAGPALAGYLGARRLTLADLTLEARVYAMYLKLFKQNRATTVQARRQATTGLSKAIQRLAAKTACQPGYIVEHCQQFKGGSSYPYSPPASVELEQLTAITTGRCYNPAVCAKQ